MTTVRVLKIQLQAGEITRRAYIKTLCDMFENDEITEREYQNALLFQPADNPGQDEKDRQYEIHRAEALEMSGLMKPEEKKKTVDPAYAKKIAEGLEMIGVRRIASNSQ